LEEHEVRFTGLTPIVLTPIVLSLIPAVPSSGAASIRPASAAA
jgi:hypothetical protein